MCAWVTNVPLLGHGALGLNVSRPRCIANPIRLHICPVVACADERKRRKRPKPPATGQSYFERNLDDLVGKRLGRGNIYYGERQGVKTDEELAMERDESTEDEANEYLKEDPIVVIGGTGRTGQWITLGLTNQNFNVRVFTRKFERAESLFGPSGSNVDVFQGDLANPDTLSEVMDGAVGLVLAASPEWWRFGGNRFVHGQGTVNAIEAAVASGTVKRIVLLSSTEASSSRPSYQVEAETALKECGIPYVLVLVPKLSDDQGGMSNIIMRQECSEGDVVPGKSLTRVDAAQVICQSFVYAKFIDEMSAADPEGDFFFGNCVIECSNGTEPSIIDRRYWKKQFSALYTSE